jgi:hypothetical protein
MKIELLILITVVPLVIGLFRINQLESADKPFLYIIAATISNEIVYKILAKFLIYSSITYNIYSILDCVLCLFLFYNWNAFTKKKLLILFFTFILIWIADTLIPPSKILEKDNFYFRIAYSIVIVLFSINIANALIVQESNKIIKNPRFLICVAFIISFTYLILFILLPPVLPAQYQTFKYVLNSLNIYNYISIIQYVLFTLAMIWLPKKKKYINPYGERSI